MTTKAFVLMDVIIIERDGVELERIPYSNSRFETITRAIDNFYGKSTQVTHLPSVKSGEWDDDQNWAIGLFKGIR